MALEVVKTGVKSEYNVSLNPTSTLIGVSPYFSPLRKNLWVDSGQIVEFVLFLQFFASFRAFEIWRSDS